MALPPKVLTFGKKNHKTAYNASWGRKVSSADAELSPNMREPLKSPQRSRQHIWWVPNWWKIQIKKTEVNEKYPDQKEDEVGQRTTKFVSHVWKSGNGRKKVELQGVEGISHVWKVSLGNIVLFLSDVRERRQGRVSRKGWEQDIFQHFPSGSSQVECSMPEAKSVVQRFQIMIWRLFLWRCLSSDVAFSFEKIQCQ